MTSSLAPHTPRTAMLFLKGFAVRLLYGVVGFVLLAFVLSLLLIRPKVTVAVGTHAIRWTGRTLPWSEVRGIRKARGRMEVFDSAGRVLQSPRLHDEEVLDAVVDAELRTHNRERGGERVNTQSASNM